MNRATLAVLAVIGCLGLSEEIWSTFLSLHLRDQTSSADPTRAVATAALYVGVIASVTNLLEGFGYVIGGSIAHRMGPRVALAVSVVPMALGFTIMLSSREPWAIAIGAVLITNWEPLSVPATFDVVCSEVPNVADLEEAWKCEQVSTATSWGTGVRSESRILRACSWSSRLSASLRPRTAGLKALTPTPRAQGWPLQRTPDTPPLVRGA